MDRADEESEISPPEPACLPARTELQQFLDGLTAVASTAVRAHRESCATCRAEWILATRLADRLTWSAPPVVPVSLADRITSVVVADRRRRVVRRWVGAGSALAASIAIVVAAWQMGSPRSAVVVSEVSQRVDSPVAHVAKVPEPVEPLGQSVDRAKGAVVSLTTRTARETFGQALGVWTAVSKPPVDPLGDVALPRLASSTSKSMEPLTDTAKRAADMFLKLVDAPSGNDPKRKVR